MTDEPPACLLCHRCGIQLTPGRGHLYVIHIEAVADPWPPVITEADLARDHQRDMADLIHQLRHHTERDLLDQVHRRLTIHLCTRCYKVWIENPTG
jgi:hypothetical protein